jgi:hypothetical protein
VDRRQKNRRHARPLRLEWLEDRRLLAYNVTETGSVGNETLVISKAAGDTADLTMTADALGDLTLADPNNTFTGGPLLGVTFNANSIVVDQTLAGVVHLDVDFSANNGESNNFTVGDLSGATIPGFDMFSSSISGTDTLTLSTSTINTGSSTAANASISLGSGNLGHVTYLVITQSVTIKTAQLPTDEPGAVNLGAAEIGATSANEDLTIDASAVGQTINGGSVTLMQASGPPFSFVDDLLIDTAGGSDGVAGVITLGDMLQTTGSQTYMGPVVIAPPSYFVLLTGEGTDLTSSNGDITFDSTVDGTNGQEFLYVSAAGMADFKGVVGGSTVAPTLEGLRITGAAQIEGGSVSTTWGQDYDGAVAVTRSTTFTSIGSPTSQPAFWPSVNSIDFDSTLDGSGGIYGVQLTVGPGEVTLGGSIGGSATTPDVGALNVDAGQVTIGGAAIRTAGSQTYSGAVLLTHDAALLSTGFTDAQDPSQDLASGIDFAASIDGAFNLLIDSDGSINLGNSTFSSPPSGDGIGGITPLASLTVQGYTTPATGVTMVKCDVTTSGSQTYDNPAVVRGFPVVTPDIWVIGGVNAQPDGASTLTSSAGDIVFNSTVGGNVELTTNSPGATTFNALVDIFSLTVGNAQAHGITHLNTSTVDTVGWQTYYEPLLLANHPVLNSSQGGITFNSTVGGNSALTTSSAQATTFNALVSIASISSGGSGTTHINTGTVNTVGPQVYNVPLLLANHPVLVSSQGDLTFNSTVGGNSALTAVSPGLITFEAQVSIVSLVSSGVAGHGVTKIGAASINTTGSQTYYAPLLFLSSNPTLTSAKGDIAFDSTVGGNSNLTINNPGSTTFNALVSIASLTVNGNGATNLGGGPIVTTGAQTYNTHVVLLSNMTLVSNGGGNLTFASTVSAAVPPKTLTVSTSGQVTFKQPVSHGVSVFRD